MKDAVRNLLFLSVLLFAVSYDSCVTGVNYDRKHKLYPESAGSCMMIVGYGYRWMRLGFAAFSAGSVIVITMLYVLNTAEKCEKLPSILIKDEDRA